MLYLVTLISFYKDKAHRSSRIVRSTISLIKEDNIVLYDLLWKDPYDDEDIFSREDCEIEVQEMSLKTFNTKKKEKIMKDILIRAGEGIMENLELPEEEHPQVDEWLAGQRVSLEELQLSVYMSQLYEIHRVETWPENKLPLLIGNLTHDGSRTALEKRMKA